MAAFHACDKPTLSNNSDFMSIKTKDIGKIRIELCKMNCRIHHRLPEIKKTGDQLEFHTCCEDFKAKLEMRFEELLAETPVK